MLCGSKTSTDVGVCFVSVENTESSVFSVFQAASGERLAQVVRKGFSALLLCFCRTGDEIMEKGARYKSPDEHQDCKMNRTGCIMLLFFFSSRHCASLTPTLVGSHKLALLHHLTNSHPMFCRCF